MQATAFFRLWLARALGLSAAVTLALTLLSLSQRPLARPLVARGAEDAGRVLDRMLAVHVTEAGLTADMEAATKAGDLDAIALTRDLAARRGVSLPPETMARAAAVEARANTLAARGAACASCAWDPATCDSVRRLATCALPVEITPLGDLNALRRAAADHAAGRTIDRVDAGLGLVGLAATAGIVATGGTSAALKAGTGALRLAHRTGSLTDPVRASLVAQAAATEWAQVPRLATGKARLADVTDAAQLARLGDMAGDMGDVARATSPADAIALLRLVDTPEDAADLARLARIEGPATRATAHGLGKARAFRALYRLSDAALAALALLSLLAAQVTALALWALRRLIRPRCTPVPRTA